MDEMYPDKNFTFKVESRRAKSLIIRKILWNSNVTLEKRILYAFPESGIKVDVHHPDVMVNVEVRNEIYIYSKIIPGPGGCRSEQMVRRCCSYPAVSTARLQDIWYQNVALRLRLLISMLRRIQVSVQNKKLWILQKKVVSAYSGPIKLHVVNFTDIQLYIYDQCPHDELTIIMRRYMMRIAEHFAKRGWLLRYDHRGESIGQVASQTMQSLAATNDVCTLPVYRPLIAFDKQEIVDVSLKKSILMRHRSSRSKTAVRSLWQNIR